MNAPVSTEQQATLERAGRQAQVVAALQQVLPQHALLWNREDTTPYECDGLTVTEFWWWRDQMRRQLGTEQ